MIITSPIFSDPNLFPTDFSNSKEFSEKFSALVIEMDIVPFIIQKHLPLNRLPMGRPWEDFGKTSGRLWEACCKSVGRRLREATESGCGWGAPDGEEISGDPTKTLGRP